jgi:hypothetical protein
MMTGRPEAGTDRLAQYASIVFLCLLLPLKAAAGEVPDVILNPDGKPLWVSVDRALDERGKLKPETLGDYGARAEDRLRRSNEYAARAKKAQPSKPLKPKPPELEGCVTFSVDLPEHPVPPSSLSALTYDADVIVAARVVDVRQGFMNGGAGSLLVLDAEYLKGKPTIDTYLYYPMARIETSEGLLCTTPLGNFIPPRIGDRMLVFSMGEPRQFADQTILYVNPARELVHESRGREMILPQALAAQSPRQFEDAKRAVLESLGVTKPR